MKDPNTITVSLAGKDITFSTGKIARQANGAVMVQSGETMVLCSACAAAKPAPDIDFFPLRVDYQEKFSSTGKTLGGFIKREGRPTERETLVCRLIDRPLRPMFEEGYFNEVQILTYVLSYDPEHAPEPLAICGASAALAISDIPLIKPVAAVRVGLIDDQFVINPSFEDLKLSQLDLFLAGTQDAILMIEGNCDFLTEEKLLEAVQEGHEAISKICQAIQEWQDTIGKPKARDYLRIPPTELSEEIERLVGKELKEVVSIQEKKERENGQKEITEKVLAELFPDSGDAKYTKVDVMAVLKKVTATHMRNRILNENTRPDGRKTDQIRPISIETGLLPRTHGSALFTRGETQAIAVCTLGGENMGQRFESLNEDSVRRFYLQYSFPPFSVGEVGRVGPVGRREVGHGKLAEVALVRTLPSQEHFPYTIRLESNITESNGSSSMASVCGGSLALMQAGVPIKHPISGIAMGLIIEGDKYAILSDILGVEDALGDMDFKITGSEKGITAFQLDIKVEGITQEIMQVALNQAKHGRLHILKKMVEVCPKHEEQLSTHAPKIVNMQIKPSKIGIVIGPGGKQIRAIAEETGANLDIDDSGLVSISAPTVEGLERAKEIVFNLTADVEIGQTYDGKVVSIVDFGMFVEIFSKQGLCHISQIAHEKIRDIDHIKELFSEGDAIEVKVLDINDRGQISLSRKVLLPREERPRDEGGGNDQGSGERREKRPLEKKPKPQLIPPPPIPQR